MVSVVLVSVLAAGPLELSKLGNEGSLAELLWREAPELQDARVRVAQAEAERRKALRLPNPGLDVSLNTLPVGPLNPGDLKDPFLNVPNVAVSLSVLLELGKREPRQEATAEAARAAALEALEQLRQKVLELEDVVGDVAAAQVRVDAFTGLTEDARRLAELQQARAQKGDSSDLDADRARLEQESALTALGEARVQLAAALASCAQVLSTTCTPFLDASAATAWLERRSTFVPGELARRPDLRALEASLKAAQAAQRLAANGWLPDPTLRVGYVRDQFVVSGNQQNSLFVGLSLPLPLFQHGQDDAEAAAIAARAAERSHQLLLQSARVQLDQLKVQLEAMEARHERVNKSSLPLARAVVDRLTAAVNRGAAPIQELLFARRTLAELTLADTELDRTIFHVNVARERLAGSLDALPTP